MQSKLKLFTLCQYLTDTETEWRQEDWTAYKMVKSLKGHEVKGYFELSLSGKTRRFDNANSAEFAKLVPGALSKVLSDEFQGGAAIVPIPNSNVTSLKSEPFNTLHIARSMNEIAGPKYPVEPLLVFKEAQVPSHKGGRRSPQYFETAYNLINNTDMPIVLIDDVCTTGAHFIGACWKLHSSGMNVIGAIAFGKSTKQRFDKAIERRAEELDLTKYIIDFSH
jgi:hypothetical protein